MREKCLVLWLLLLAPFSYGAGNWRQVSTATTFNIGPLIKIADGSYEDSATITGISLSFIKQSATMAPTVTTVSAAVSGSANDCVYVAKGTYNCELSTGNTDTLGVLDIRATYTGTYGAKTSLQIVHANSIAVLQTGTIATPLDVHNVLVADIVTANTIGLLQKTNLDATISSRATSSDLAAYSDRMVSTTIATLSSQVGGTLTAGSPDNDAYNEATAIIIDESTPLQQCAAVITDYVGSTKTYTLKEACSWAISTGDTIKIFANPASAGAASDVNVVSWNGTAVATPDTPGYPKVTIKDGTGQGELSITAGQFDGSATPAQIGAALMATPYEGAETFKDFLRLGASMLFRNYTSSGTTFQFKGLSSGKTRVNYSTTTNSRTVTSTDVTD